MSRTAEMDETDGASPPPDPPKESSLSITSSGMSPGVMGAVYVKRMICTILLIVQWAYVPLLCYIFCSTCFDVCT